MRDTLRIKQENEALDRIGLALRALAFNAGLTTEEIDAITQAHAPKSHYNPAIRRLYQVQALADEAMTLTQRSAGFIIIDTPPDGVPGAVEQGDIPGGMLPPIVEGQEDALHEAGPYTRETDPETLDLLGLPDNIFTALFQAGFETIHDVATASNNELLAVKGIGQASLNILHEALESFRAGEAEG